MKKREGRRERGLGCKVQRIEGGTFEFDLEDTCEKVIENLL